MQVKLRVNKVQEEMFEVQFPIYGKQDIYVDYPGSDIEIFWRVEHIPRQVHYAHCEYRTCTITMPNDMQKVEIEVDNDYPFTGTDPDYTLGRGKYASNEAEFKQALENAKLFLAKI